MIDIHAHILPGIDDGPRDISQAIGLIRQAEHHGVRAMIATPHSQDGVYNAAPEEILKACSRLNDRIDACGIDMTILPGAENRLTHDMVERFDQGQMITLGSRSKYLLLELPPMFLVQGVSRTIQQFVDRGVTPVIAHPERNSSLMKHPAMISALARDGALMQLTACSLTGDFGRPVMKFSEQMILHGMVAFVASDIHPGRRYRMQDAFSRVARLAGNEVAESLFYNNPGQAVPDSIQDIRHAL